MQFKPCHDRQKLEVLYQTNAFLVEKRLLEPEQRILIAVSGGQDSMCILSILYKLRKHWGWKLGIVYCDHSWYVDSKKQGEHVAQLAINMQIDYYQGTSTSFIGSETLARDWRYKLLKRIAVCQGYSAVVTGHSASDRVETMLYNLIRGSGTKGLQSLSWKRTLDPVLKISSQNAMKRVQSIACIDSFHSIRLLTQTQTLSLVRPLLGLTRTELKKITEQWQLSLWEDSTNQSLQIRRNRIRNQLLPYLRRHFNPNVDRALINCAEIVQAESVYLENFAKFIRSSIESSSFSESFLKNSINLNLLRSLPTAVQRRVIKQFLDFHLTKSPKFEQVERIRLLYSSGMSVDPNGGTKTNTKLLKNKRNRKDLVFNQLIYLSNELLLGLCHEYIVIIDKDSTQSI